MASNVAFLIDASFKYLADILSTVRLQASYPSGVSSDVTALTLSTIFF